MAPEFGLETTVGAPVPMQDGTCGPWPLRKQDFLSQFLYELPVVLEEQLWYWLQRSASLATKT